MTGIFYITIFFLHSAVRSQPADVQYGSHVIREIYSKQFDNGKLTVVLKSIKQKEVRTIPGGKNKKYARHCDQLFAFWEARPQAKKLIWQSNPVTYTSDSLCMYPDNEFDCGPMVYVYDSTLDGDGNILLLQKFSSLRLVSINLSDEKAATRDGIRLVEPLKTRCKYAFNFPEKMIILSARIIITAKDHVYVFAEQNGRDVLWDCSSKTPAIEWQRETKTYRNGKWHKFMKSR